MNRGILKELHSISLYQQSKAGRKRGKHSGAGCPDCPDHHSSSWAPCCSVSVCHILHCCCQKSSLQAPITTTRFNDTYCLLPCVQNHVFISCLYQSRRKQAHSTVVFLLVDHQSLLPYKQLSLNSV